MISNVDGTAVWQPPPRYLVIAARLFAGLMIMPMALGCVWFWSGVDVWAHAYGIASVLVFAAAVLAHPKLAGSALGKWLLVALYAGTVTLHGKMLIDDLRLSDLGGLVVRVLGIAALCVLIADAGTARHVGYSARRRTRG